MSLRKEKLTEKAGHTKVNRKVRAKEIEAEKVAEGKKRKPHPDKTKLEKNRDKQRKDKQERAAYALETVTLNEPTENVSRPREEVSAAHKEEITTECAKTWLGTGKED